MKRVQYAWSSSDADASQPSSGIFTEPLINEGEKDRFQNPQKQICASDQVRAGGSACSPGKTHGLAVENAGRIPRMEASLT